MKTIFIHFRFKDKSKDYSELKRFLKGKEAMPLFNEDNRLVKMGNLSEGVQALRDQLQEFLHEGDQCAVLEVLAIAQRPSF